MPNLGKAYVEVRADLSKFPAELRSKLKAAFAEGVKGVDFHEIPDAAEKAGTEAGHKATKGFEQSAVKDAERVGGRVGRGILGAIGRVFSRGGDSGTRNSFAVGIGKLFDGAKDAIQSGLQGVQSVGKSIGSIFSGLSGGGGDVLGALKVTAIIAAIPAVFGLAGALVHLSGILLALPAAAGVAASAIIPLVIAFHGFGEAIGAGFSGDTEKFKAALKGLAEPAREVVKEIVGLKSAFSAIRNDVQTAFFAPLIGQFKALGKTFLPTVRAGLTEVADALGNLAGGFLTVLRSNEAVGAINTILLTTAGIVRQLTPVLSNLFASFLSAMQAGAPAITQLSQGLGSALTKFTNFINGAIADGSFTKFLNDSINITKELFAILGSTGKLIGAIFGGNEVEQGSEGFLKDIKTAIDQLTTFFQSKQGQDAIHSMVTSLKTLGIVLIATAIFTGRLIHWIDAFGRGLITGTKAVGDFLGAVGSGFVAAISAIGSFFSTIGGAIADFFTKTIPDAFNAVVGFFQSLPDQAVSAGKSLQQKLLDWITGAFTAVRDFAARQIGELIGLFLAAPFLISQAVQNLGPFLLGKFTEALEAVKGFVVTKLNEIGDFFAGLPLRVSIAIARITPLVSGVFHDALEAAKGWVSSGINAISNFFGSLPGRVSALGPAMLNAARSLGHKIGDGLSEIGNFASDIGKKIVSTIRSGVNSIIDSINRGIGDIDNSLPISLPRLPHLERGGIVDSPTVALLGEKGKREVVVPLTDPGRAAELAQQSGLTKILGASSGSPTVHLTAILDGFGVLNVVDMRINQKLDEQGRELAFGTR